MYAPGSRQVESSKIRTLSVLARAIGKDLIPLDPDTLEVIFGALRVAGYRGAVAYISTARVAHQRAGYEIGPSLRLFLRDAERAVTRGIGPPIRAAVLDPLELIATKTYLSWIQQGTHQRGPALAWYSFSIAVWWLLRTEELIWLTLASVRIHYNPVRAELRLGATKADIRGLGCIRVHECACTSSGGDLRKDFCPACVLRTVVDIRREAGASDQDFLFVDPLGRQVSCGAVGATWNAFGSRFIRHEPGHNTRPQLSKHSGRRIGAQMLVQRGRSQAEA